MGIQRIGILTLDPSSLEGHIGGKELSSHARRSAPPMSLDGRLPTFAVARIGAWRHPALNVRRRPIPDLHELLINDVRFLYAAP